MAIVQVQKKPAISNAVAFDSNNTGGNFLVAMLGLSATASGVTDTAGNTWVKAFESPDGGAIFAAIWYVLSAISGANTVTAANVFGSSFCHIAVAEYSGIDTVVGIDKSTSQLSPAISGTAFTSGNTATTSQADELLIAIVATSVGKTVVWDAGWTEEYDDNAAGASRSLSWASQIVSSTGAYAASGTFSSATQGQPVGIATFKGAAAGGSSGGPLTRGGSLTHGALTRGGRISAAPAGFARRDRIFVPARLAA